jgi:death on curing protein
LSEPVWITKALVEAIHARQLREFGGSPGLRDVTMLASALDRPRNKWAHERAGLAELAASYAYGITSNHPFVDGNKRVAFLTMVVFLDLNDIAFNAPDPEAILMMLELASGGIKEEGLILWIKDKSL